jgi:hypothetical protein
MLGAAFSDQIQATERFDNSAVGGGLPHSYPSTRCRISLSATLGVTSNENQAVGPDDAPAMLPKSLDPDQCAAAVAGTKCCGSIVKKPQRLNNKTKAGG